jgi:EAL domain-containing protein (putative c-di-GMP-specific phosphodiesterase class I)/ActR/RegA family two-component response regulator
MNCADLAFLVVDDDDFQRWMMEQILRRLGAATVTHAADGQAALEHIAREPVNVVVSDLDMPGMDGLEFLRRLGQVARAPAVIVASAHSQTTLTAVESMAEEYGVWLLGSLAKPTTAPQIAAAMLPYLEQGANGAHAPRTTSYPLDELREALVMGGIRAQFQPKVDVATGAVIGAEALARWVSRTGAVTLPNRFIPQLEREGLMGQLTETIMEQACAACVSWMAEGLPGSVSVNVSLASLADAAFVERIGAIVARHGLNGTNVIIEITESMATHHVGALVENAARLRMRGFGLAIDDYGTGYSTLQQLTRIPFTELKVDQSFVRTATSRRASRAVLESSVEMAAKLGIPAVAEGVETDAQLELVRELGCRTIQGWRFGKAMAVGDFIIHARRASH